MLSQIACKLKNSFAIDSKEDLYSWGYFESGLLGYDEQTDVQTPTKISFEAYGEEFKVESISLGHFHAAAICKLKDYHYLSLNINNEVLKVVDTFRSWHSKNFIWEIPDVKSFCKGILKRDSFFRNVKYKDLKEYLLETFFEYMKINKKDSFNMRSFYESNLKTILGLTNDESEISNEKFESIFLSDDKKPSMMTVEEKNILCFIDFLNKSHEHMKTYNNDVPFFIRFVTNFKSNITMEDVKRVLDYGYSKVSINDIENRDKIEKAAQEIFNCVFFEVSKNVKDNLNKNSKIDDLQNEISLNESNHKSYKNNLMNNNYGKNYRNNDHENNNKLNINNKKIIPVRHLIDIICGKKMGDGILFSWGVNCDGRLGYRLTPDYDLEYLSKNSNQNNNQNSNQISTYFNSLTQSNLVKNKANNNYIMELSQLQINPRIIGFEALYKIEKVACGYNHTLALTESGRVFSWGNGKYGCLGNSKDESNYVPKIIELDSNHKQFTEIKSIGAGMFYSIATCKEKHLYSWGCGNNGRLGHGNDHSVSAPKKITFFETNKISVKSFSCGDTHIAIISNTDTLYSWGSGTYGKLGHGNLQDYNVPKKIESLKNSKIDIVSCGSNDTIAVTSDLKVFTWGKNSSGLLGTSQQADKNIPVPTLMNLVIEDAKIGIVDVSVGSMHVLLKLSNGDLFTCGNVINGISGIRNQKDKILEPRKIPEFKCITEDEDKEDYKNLIKGFNLGFTLKKKKNDKKVCFIYAACSQDNTAFITQNGDLFMSGNKRLIYSSDKINSNYNLESNNQINVVSSNLIMNLENNKNAKETVNLTLAQTNETFNGNTPGLANANMKTPSNANHQNQKNIDLSTPGLTPLDENDNKQNSNNNNFNNSELNNFNLNFINQDKDSKLVRRIMFSQKVSYIAISKNHAIMVSEHKAYSWGKTENGILGLGDRKENFIEKPTLISKLPSNLCMVCCSDSHSMALTLNGEIYAFGLNTYGKLGIGSLSKYLDFTPVKETDNAEEKIDLPIEYEPQLVKDISFAYFIACGNNHSACIMKNEEKKNSVFTWGAGYAGKLANNESSKDAFLPQQCLVKENSHFIRVTCGDEFTLALDQKGRLYGAGKNIYLGISKKNDLESQLDITSTLKHLSEENRFKFISSSNHYSVALDRHGKMWGFGKIFREKFELDLQRTEIKSLEKMKFIACGQNHFAAFSNDGNSIYTWGSNSFYKCGHDYNKDDNGKVIMENKVKFIDIPRKLKLDNFEKLDFNLNLAKEDEENNNDSFSNQNDEVLSNSDNNSNNCKNEKMENIEDYKDVKDQIESDHENLDYNSDLEKKNLHENNGIKIKVKSNNDNKRAHLQLALLQERPENKNLGLLEEDSKLIEEFYKALSFIKNNLRNNETEYNKFILETENNILRFLNSASDFKLNNNYHSNIPKIINMNFQIYESFLNVIQQHPCYIADLLKNINNKKSFEYILKLIYGRVPSLLNDKRVNNLLLGLWNNLFSTDKRIDAAMKNDENPCYKIYKLILNNSEQNLQVKRELVAEVFIFFINEICIYFEKEESKGKVFINNDSNLSFTYKEILETNKKQEIQQKAVISICNSILDYFEDFFILNKNKINDKNNKTNFNGYTKQIRDVSFTKHITWIYKHLILKDFKKEFDKKDDFFDYDDSIIDAYIEELESQDKNKNEIIFENQNSDSDNVNNDDNVNNNYLLTNKRICSKLTKIKKEFNNYLFSPFADLLKEVLWSSNDSTTKEIDLLQKQILIVLEKYKKRYNKIYNLYRLDPFHFKKNYINDLLSNKSLILKDIHDIFLNLSNSDFSKDIESYDKLEEMNDQFSLNITNFKWDFTFNTLKDTIKSSLEMGNHKITIPLSVEDLITLQKYFKNYLHDKVANDKDDPLNNILTLLSNFKLADLDNTSSIRNFILNFEIKPLSYVFDYADDSKIFKCSKCLLPLDQKFFPNFKQEILDEVIYGKDWDCRTDQINLNLNDKLYDESSICRGHVKQEMRCKVTGIYKPKNHIISKYNLFKKFYLKHNDKLLNLYEELLYILPKMSSEDDLFKTLEKEKEAIKSLNSKSELWKIDLIERFKYQIESSLQNFINQYKLQAERKQKLQEFNNLLESNINSRKEHLKYTNSIYELVDFMKSCVDSLKTKKAFFNKENEIFNEFVKRGASNQFLLEKTDKANIIKVYQNKLKNANNERKFYKFNVNSLISDNVIHNIEVIKEGQSNFNQKSYIVFWKSDKGYNLRFCYRETKRKYVFCGVDNQEFVLDEFVLDYEKIAELRRTAKNNPTFTIGDIRFNVFYLVKLLNSFENVDN